MNTILKTALKSSEISRHGLLNSILSGMLGNLTKHHEPTVIVSAHVQESTFISTSIAVIRGWEYRNNSVCMFDLVATHGDLMCSGNTSKSILMHKFIGCIWAEEMPDHSLWIWFKTVSLWRIRPEQVSKCALHWHFNKTINFVNVIDDGDTGRQTSVHAQEFIGDHGWNW